RGKKGRSHEGWQPLPAEPESFHPEPPGGLGGKPTSRSRRLGAADGHDAGALCATGRGNTGLTNVWISSNAVSRRLPAVPSHQPSVEGVAYTSMWTPHGARVLDPGGEAGPTVWIRRTAAVRRP